jgi:CRP-like cAMP-binding protein
MAKAGTSRPHFLAQLGPLARRALADAAQRKVYRDGQTLQMRGDPNPGLVIVINGAVRLVREHADGRRVELDTIPAGQFYGSPLALRHRVRTHGGIAVSDTIVDRISPTALDPVLTAHPEILRALLDVTTRRLFRMTELYDDARSLPPVVRIAKLLLDLGRRRGGHVGTTQAGIAEALGLSSVTVGTSLKQLATARLIATRYRAVEITDAAALRAWVAQRTGE